LPILFQSKLEGVLKIAACEHPTKVKAEMLKHAAEEFRHAYYLKSQIKKVTDQELEDYSLATILGGFSALHYLQALDVLTCQHLKRDEQMSFLEIREAAYILVTYAVELRASELYPIYHEILKGTKSRVAVKIYPSRRRGTPRRNEEGVRCSSRWRFFIESGLPNRKSTLSDIYSSAKICNLLLTNASVFAIIQV